MSAKTAIQSESGRPDIGRGHLECVAGLHFLGRLNRVPVDSHCALVDPVLPPGRNRAAQQLPKP